MAVNSPRRAASAFTLIELLVATAVLSLLVVLAVGVVGGTAKAILSSNKRQDADGQARMALDRMGADIANAARRADLDAIFPKIAGNDRMFFHSEAPAYFDASNASLFPGSAASDPKSILSLVGYRIDAESRLERLGLGLTWDGRASGSGSGGAVYLSRLNGAIDPASTLSGAWPAVVGQAPNYDGGDTTYWRVLSPQVFRMEFCFLLKDGTLSILPVLKPSGKTSNLSAQAPPTAASDSGAGYVPGSRWFDAAAQRGYVCVDNTAGAAVWNAVGTGDLAAVVVALAILDASSRQAVPAPASALRASALALPDVTAGDLAASPPHLMKKTWQAAVQLASFARSSGLPPEAAARVRIYQRYFYLNSP